MNHKLTQTAELQGHSYSIRSYRIIDGDSIWTALMLGFDTISEQICRLTGVDTPERSTKAGKLVPLVISNWCLLYGPLFAVPTNRDKFSGRYDGIIWDREEKNSLNEYLLTQGLAKAYSGGKKSRWYVKELKAIEVKVNAILKASGGMEVCSI